MQREASHSGLSSKEAKKRFFEYGENTIASGKRTSALKIFAGQFKDLMTMILLFSTVLSVLMGEIVEAIAIIVIIVVNATLGFVQEFRTEKTLEALKNMAAPAARVIRDGSQQSVPATEIVPGDLILIQAGDKIPADARLVEVVSLQCDEALLSGESVPVEKAVDDGASGQVFMGAIVTKGRGKAEVTATGMGTEMGKIAGMLHEIEEEPTPLQRKLAELGRYIAVGCIAICAVVSFTGILRGEPILDMFLTGISLAVAAVPEGLPAIVTISLALAVNRILKRNALVRRLHSVETLGCANVICTDKTGTLTENRMTVKRVFTLDYDIAVSGNGYEQAGEFTVDGRRAKVDGSPTVRRLMDICIACNNSEITTQKNKLISAGNRDRTRSSGAGSWKVEGDPTEIALLVLAAKANLDAGVAGLTREEEIPFDSESKRMTVIVRDRAGRRIALSKGAPDLLLDRCRYVMTDHGVQVLTPAIRSQILKANQDMASSALRVLGFALRENPMGLKDAESELVFVGLTGMIDPPRKEVPEAVARCRQAKIRTVMITGDHKDTACAIAKDIGILREGDMVLTGAQLDGMTEEDLYDTVHRVSVFARVSPKHKLQIVQALKRRGNVVAMTGDGVNDAPAVKEADIGVSMGITGTDVTKQASAIILLDDNFATLVAAIEEGRVVYNNIRKFIRYLLSCNIGEVITMFVGMLMGLPIVLLPVQILLVNLVTDGLPALALGLEPAEPEVMSQNPRPGNESVFSNGLATTIIFRGCMIGLTTLMVFTTFMRDYGQLELARTAALLTLVTSQLVHVFECKSETRSLWRINPLTNPALIGAVLVSGGVIALVMYHPWMQMIFRTVALTGGQLAKVIAYALAVPLVSSLWMLLPKKRKNDLELKDAKEARQI